MSESVTNKKKISAAEFQKRVEIEAENLIYFARKDKKKAFEEARSYIESKFIVE